MQDLVARMNAICDAQPFVTTWYVRDLRTGAESAEAAAFLGATPELCRLGLDILSWQRLRHLIPSLLPQKAKVAHKTGRGPRGRMDAGVVYKKDRPRFIISVYVDQLPETLPDGLPGFTAACATAGRLARACWDAMD